MWSNLKNVRSTVARIGDAIATPGQYVDDDDDEESYYEDEEGEYEDDDEYYEEEDEEEKQPKVKSPFGLVGILTRALDQEQETYDESHQEEDDEFYEDEEQVELSNENGTDLSKKLFSSPFQRETTTPDDSIEPNEAVIEDEPTQEVEEPPSATDDWDDDFQHKQQNTPAANTPQAEKPLVDGLILEASPDAAKVESLTPQVSFDERNKEKEMGNSRRATQSVVSSPHDIPAGPRHALVREKGSVSPAHHSLSRQIYTERKFSEELDRQDEDSATMMTLQLSSSNMAAATKHLELNNNHDPMVELLHDSSGEEEDKANRLSTASSLEDMPTVPTLSVKDDLLGDRGTTMPKLPALDTSSKKPMIEEMSEEPQDVPLPAKSKQPPEEFQKAPVPAKSDPPLERKHRPELPAKNEPPQAEPEEASLPIASEPPSDKTSESTPKEPHKPPFPVESEPPPLVPVDSPTGSKEVVTVAESKRVTNKTTSPKPPAGSSTKGKPFKPDIAHETPRTRARHRLKLPLPKSPAATNFDAMPPPDSSGPPTVSSKSLKEKAQTTATFTPKSMKAKAGGEMPLPPAPLSVDDDDDLSPVNGLPPDDIPPAVVVVETTQRVPQPNLQEQKRIKQLEEDCKKLQMRLQQSEAKVVQIQQEATVSAQKHDEALFIKFQEKEARLLEAAAEDHDQEMNMLRGEYEGKLSAVQRQLASEQEEYHDQQAKMEQLLQDTQRRLEEVERRSQHAQSQREQNAKGQLQQLERSLRMAEEKLAQSMALLDERDEQVGQLQQTVKTLKSSMSEHQEGAQEAEEEMDELHTENETLRHHVETVEAECVALRAKVEELHGDSEKLSAVKLELQMLKEDRARERAKIQSAAESTSATSAQLAAQRDSLAAEVQDLKRQLAAAHADVEVARADTERVMTANTNLQSALEAFQSEREAELALIDEQKLAAEEATAAAHAAALEATHEANEAEIRQIKFAAEEQIAQTREEVKRLEEKNERFRLDNVQMRRSLDEAIQRLQATQEDVIDRSLMKNILLDWLTKKATKERHQILEIMANLLHFTEEEKEKVHLDDGAGTIGRVVASVAAPLPPPKADVEHLEGDNMREKWVNFLMGETDD